MIDVHIWNKYLYLEMYIVTLKESFSSTNTGIKGTLSEKNDVY